MVLVIETVRSEEFVVVRKIAAGGAAVYCRLSPQLLTETDHHLRRRSRAGWRWS